MEPLFENKKIYVRGLTKEVTENALSEHFDKYGLVVKATVAMDGRTRQPKDFGFVWFADEDSAKAALGDVEEHVILGTKVEVREAIRRKRSPIQDNDGVKCPRNAENALGHRKKIFVGGLPHDLTQEEFKSSFESYGKTTDVVIIVGTVSRKSRGFGFVTYESEESARAVLRTSRYVIHGKEVEVKASIPKEVIKTMIHPNAHPRGQHYPSAGFNGYRHHSSFWPRYGMIGGLSYANSSPINPYANGMVAPSPANAYGMVAPSPYAYGVATPSPAYAVMGSTQTRQRVAPRPFTKIRISKPPGKNGKDSACSSPASCVEDPSPTSKDSNPSPSGKNDGNDQALPCENGQNDS